MNDMILILNFSDEFSLEAARRLRAEQVYSRILPGMTTAAQIRQNAPRGILLCGEPVSGQGVFDAEILGLGVPVLALGHASHMLLTALGGACAGVALQACKANVQYGDSPLFIGMEGGERYLQETLTLMLPVDVQMAASAGGCTVAFADEQRKIYGVQFELERNDPDGSTILKNFARDICCCTPWFTMEAARAEVERQLVEAANHGGQAVCAVSGGVDSTVSAVLTYRAFGERMTAIYVETGLMRKGESARVQQTFAELGVPLRMVDRSGVVLDALTHRRSMSEKRDVVFACLRDEMIRQSAAISDSKTLVLGTNYSDFLGGVSNSGWKDCGMITVEPLRVLFKEEVRAIAADIGLPAELVQRKPFPLMGLGARILGEVTEERLHALRTAEDIFSQEIEEAGLSRKLYKYFPILAESDAAQHTLMVILRAVSVSGGVLVPARLPYDLVERSVQRILESTPSVVRVFYDQTPTPVGKEAFA